MVLRKLLDHLQVEDITLVCQDWGGLTGLSVVKDAPHMFSDLVIMNTGLPAPILDLSDDYGASKMGGSMSMSKKIIGVSHKKVNCQKRKHFIVYCSFCHSVCGDVL